jgi:hypothetical protein
MTGLFTKPITEYQDYRDNREYAKSKEEVRGASTTELDHANHLESTSDGASAATSANNPMPERKAISAGHLAGASGMSIAMFAPKALKGLAVDIPLALTEGFKNMPRQYGDVPRDHGPVTGFRSGAAVAGKTFAWGFADGLSDIVVKPYQGAREEGWKGATKGLGKGMAGMATKTGAGMFGLWGYTSAGIAKSLRTAVYSKTRKRITEARRTEGRWLMENSMHTPEETEQIAARILALRGKRE